MTNSFYKLLIPFTYLVLSLNGFAQNIPIKLQLQNIIVEKDTSFVNYVSISIKENEELIVFPIFYDSEIETISDIKLFTKKGNRYKEKKNNFILEEDVELDYIASKKVKSIFVPSKTEAKITYTIRCKELMYLSNLRFFSNNELDTLKYKLTVPSTFRFVHNTIYKDSLNYISIDSTRSSNTMKWNITVTPEKVEPDPLMFFGIYKNIKMPLMRTLFFPASYESKAKEYMNDWYYDQLDAKRGLGYNAKYKIDQLTKYTSDPNEIMEILYSFVKTNFKYVAVEIGMGAYIPSHVNDVFVNKQGDCKDLSNFLSEALKYKGIKSNIALAATTDHISDCDFPSLSSANHVICVAYIEDKSFFLDPTDPIHLPELPIQSLQNRSIFVVNLNGGEFKRVPKFTTQQNVINYNLNLRADSETMEFEGYFKARYQGVSGNFLRRISHYFDDEVSSDAIKKHYEAVFGNQPIFDMKVSYSEKEVMSVGKIIVQGKLIKGGNDRFLFIDFLPRLMETQERETLLEGTPLDTNFSKIVNVQIILDEPFKDFIPLNKTITYKGMSLNLTVSSEVDNIINCNYEFVYDYFLIDKNNMSTTNDILTLFKKITDEPIIFKEKL